LSIIKRNFQSIILADESLVDVKLVRIAVLSVEEAHQDAILFGHL